jgi:hypothetical protein
MGKRFKGKICVYCAGASETGDHILAREFVPVARRQHIPQVPACWRCNNDKSGLVLKGNERLHRELARGRSRLSKKEPSGLLVNALTVPIDSEKVEKLIGLIARGLIWHHWKIVLGPESFVDVLSITTRDEARFETFVR